MPDNEKEVEILDDSTTMDNKVVPSDIFSSIPGQDEIIDDKIDIELSDEETLKQNAIEIFDVDTDEVELLDDDEIAPKEEISEFVGNANNNYEQNTVVNEVVNDSVENIPMVEKKENVMFNDAALHANTYTPFESDKPVVAPIEEKDEKNSKNTIIFITIIFIILLVAVFLIPKFASVLS